MKRNGHFCAGPLSLRHTLRYVVVCAGPSLMAAFVVLDLLLSLWRAGSSGFILLGQSLQPVALVVRTEGAGVRVEGGEEKMQERSQALR